MKKEEEPNLDVPPLFIVAVQTHELYEQLKKAGFSRKEALYIVAQIMAHGMTTAGE